MEEFWVKDIQNYSRDIWRFRGDTQIPIFSVSKPLRDLLLPCCQSKFGVEQVHAGIIWSPFLGECSCLIFPWKKKKIKDQSVAEVARDIGAKRENCIDSRSHHFRREGEEGLVLVDCGGHWVPGMCQCQKNRHAVDHGSAVGDRGTYQGPLQGEVLSKLQMVCGGEWTPESQRSCSWKKEPMFGASAMSLLSVSFAVRSFWLTCPSLQLQRGQKQHSEWQRKSGRIRQRK